MQTEANEKYSRQTSNCGRFKILLYLEENKVQKSLSALFCVLMPTVSFYRNLAQLSNLCKFDTVLCMLPSLELVVAEVTWTLWYGKSFEVSEKESK